MKSAWISKVVVIFAAVFLVVGISMAQDKPKPEGETISPAIMLAKGMTDRLSDSLDVKKAVGKPIKVGNVTIVPIIMIDVSFGGGGGGPAGQPQMGAHGFGFGGEAKPLGFVVISKAGVKFVPVGKVPRK
ncbi:MAG: hypothetical protein JSV17_13590 [Candidatus Aminicenantes bacterium]|nr:MAG: hypothetical protein JSV17_13590 [Candidatus Aminicenantes bacterium]